MDQQSNDPTLADRLERLEREYTNLRRQIRRWGVAGSESPSCWWQEPGKSTMAS